MKLASRRLSLSCPVDLPRHKLRAWLLEQLRREGEPLRWAITAVDRDPAGASTLLQVEAVLIQ